MGAFPLPLVRTGLAALVVAVPPVLIEAALRLAEYRTSTVLHAPDGDLTWWNLPGQRVRTVAPDGRQNDATLNAMGLRGAETTAAKPRGTRRVLCVGDSYTFGWGVGDHESYPARLEAGLRAGPGGSGRYEVLNAGCYGYTILQEEAFLRTKGLGLGPDEVLIGLNRTDLEELKHYPETLAGMRRGPTGPLDRLIARTRTGQALLDWKRPRPAAAAVASGSWAAEPGYDEYLRHLLSAARLARRRGARVWLVNFDYGGREGGRLMRLLAGPAKEAGLLIEDLSALPFMSDPAYRLADGHLNARGYEAVAERLSRRILEREARR